MLYQSAVADMNDLCRYKADFFLVVILNTITCFDPVFFAGSEGELRSNQKSREHVDVGRGFLLPQPYSGADPII